jgi:hypothetical protein
VHVNPLDESPQPLDLESVSEIFTPITIAEDHMTIEV